jgi:hypothetical protein
VNVATDFDPEELAYDTVNFCREIETTIKAAPVIINIESRLPTAVKGWPIQIQQALYCLLTYWIKLPREQCTNLKISCHINDTI